jgi:hypothetical protein
VLVSARRDGDGEEKLFFEIEPDVNLFFIPKERILFLFKRFEFNG